ncbi:MAG: substrate-binding domain-containing protein [Lentisphaerae bacterium]|nr:substrate-binding domain-containing protein [Lentisphaerota bacterium]
MSKRVPKYIAFSEQLKGEIRSGKYARGSQLPGVRELCSRFGVSYLTVSNILQVLEGDGYVKRLQGKGTFVTDPQAATVEGKTQVGYLVDINISTFGKLFAAIQEVLNGQPFYNIPLHTSFGSGTPIEQAEEWLDQAMKNRYHSLVIYGDRHFPYRHLRNYLTDFEQLNFVIFDSCAVPFGNVNRILSDMKQAGYLAGRYFLEQGRRKLAVLGLQRLDDMYCRRFGIRNDNYVHLLLDGVECAYDEAGLDFYQLVRLIDGPASGIRANDERFHDELRGCFEDECEAFLAVGDFRAPAIYRMAKEMNVTVGQDIAVMGMLNTVATCELMEPTLSSISINEREIGHLTAQALQEKWKNETILVKPELVIRNSSGTKISSTNS